MTLTHGSNLTVFAMVALGLCGTASAAAAQESSFGCAGLEQSSLVRAEEGKDGVFYRVATDLTMGQIINHRAADAVARIARALEEQGTTLIFAPVPTKGQAMPEDLPSNFVTTGYDVEKARAEYAVSIANLRESGVVAADLLTRMLDTFDPAEVAKYGTENTPLFFRSDYHWTSEGARRAARAVADQIVEHPGYGDLTPTSYQTRQVGELEGFSNMRRAMQRQCRDPLPEVETLGFETNADTTPAQDDAGPLDIFADAEEQSQVVLLGTSFSDNPTNNFAGWISQYSGLEVLNYAVTGGGQYGALISYLTSQDYLEQRPRFIVWENPIYTDLLQFGTGPIEELTAAASAACSDPLNVTATSETLEAELGGATFDTDDAILARFGSEGPRNAEFTLVTTDGVSRRYFSNRDDRLRATGNFWLGLGPYVDLPIESIKVAFDRPIPNGASLSLCPNFGE